MLTFPALQLKSQAIWPKGGVVPVPDIHPLDLCPRELSVQLSILPAAAIQDI